MDVENFPDYTSALPIYIAEGNAEYRGSRKGERKVKTILSWQPGKKKAKQLLARFGGLCTPRRSHLHARLAPGAVFRLEGEPVKRKQTCLWSRGVLFCSLLLPFCLHLIHSLLRSCKLAVVSVEEKNNGFREASALGLFFLLNTVLYQGMETQKELLPFEDVTFGLPHRQKKRLFCYKPSLFWGVMLPRGGSAAQAGGGQGVQFLWVLRTAQTLVPLHRRFASDASVLPPWASWVGLPTSVQKIRFLQWSHHCVISEVGSSL